MRTACLALLVVTVRAQPAMPQRPDLQHPDPRVRSSLDLALRSWRARDFVAAKSHYDAALSADPKSAYALMGRGRALAEMGDTTAAIADLRRAGDLGLVYATQWADKFEQERAAARAPAVVEESVPTPPPRECNDCSSLSVAGRSIYADTRWFVTAPFAKYVGVAMLVMAMLMAMWVRFTPHGEIPEYAIHRGEKVRWVGSPSEGLRIYAVDVVRVPMSILFAAVLVSNLRDEGFFDFADYWNSPLGWVFIVVASPLIAAAIYGLFGRFFDDARRRKRTLYAITNQRAITVVGKRMSWRMVRSLSHLTVRQHLNGSGSIYGLGPELELDLRYAEDENFRPRKRTSFDKFLENARGPQWDLGRGDTPVLLFESVQHADLALQEIERVKAEPPPHR